MVTASEGFGLIAFVLWMFEAITPLHHSVSEAFCHCDETVVELCFHKYETDGLTQHYKVSDRKSIVLILSS